MAKSNRTLLLLPLRAIIIKRAIKKRNIELIPEMKQRRLRAETLLVAIKKSPILL